jgi:hypothetical protein
MAVNIRFPSPEMRYHAARCHVLEEPAVSISSQQIMMQAAGCSKILVPIQCNISEPEVFIENHVSMKAELKIKFYKQ